jgi:hypothetical protein
MNFLKLMWLWTQLLINPNYYEPDPFNGRVHKKCLINESPDGFARHTADLEKNRSQVGCGSHFEESQLIHFFGYECWWML